MHYEPSLGDTVGFKQTKYNTCRQIKIQGNGKVRNINNMTVIWTSRFYIYSEYSNALR